MAFALVTSSAFGQESQDVAAARALGQKGTLAAQAGKCDEAVDLLTRARALVSVPTVLTPLGECQIKLGKLVDGTEALQASVRFELEANPPKAFVKAQARAKDLLASTLPRLAHLTIEVKAPKGAKPKVTDNGALVSDVLVGVERPVDPGKHSIEVTAPGFLPGRITLQLAEGQRDSAPIELAPDPHASAPPPDEPTTPPTKPLAPLADEPPQPRGKGQIVAGAVTLAAGGVLGILGGVFGGMALSKKSTLDGVCQSGQCPTTSQGDIDSMKTFANTSTALVVIGGAAAVTGVVVLVTAPSDKAPKKARIDVHPFVGLGAAGVAGSF
jgi:hypothetical protein